MSNTKESIVLKYDNAGIPSVMVKVENTAPTPEEADPMFFVRGVEYDAIYLSQFLNNVIDGRAYSLPLQDPYHMISMDDAIKACRKKGPDWHLLTWAEWAYIRRHTIPGIHGNTWDGHYHADEKEAGIRMEYGRTLTGSGPATWFHNGTKAGIADVVGNVWKMIAGIRLKNGVLEYIPDNDAAAHGADLSENSKEYKAVLAGGNPVKIGLGSEGMMITTGEVQDWAAVSRKEVKIELPEVPEILKTLGIITEGMETSDEWFAADPELEEAVLFVSGGCSHTSSAGPSALNLSYPRSYVWASVGFFSACLGIPVFR